MKLRWVLGFSKLQSQTSCSAPHPFWMLAQPLMKSSSEQQRAGPCASLFRAAFLSGSVPLPWLLLHRGLGCSISSLPADYLWLPSGVPGGTLKLKNPSSYNSVSKRQISCSLNFRSSQDPKFVSQYYKTKIQGSSSAVTGTDFSPPFLIHQCNHFIIRRKGFTLFCLLNFLV